jgi:hypothetical protein
MDLQRVPPSATRALALAGAATVAVGGFLPHHICWDAPVCAVPWLSLAPLAVALAVVRRGWTERLTTALWAVTAVFWVAGLFLVLENFASVVSDALVGTGRTRTFHRVGAALYFYGASMALAAVTVRIARRVTPAARRLAVFLALGLTLVPVLGAAPTVLAYAATVGEAWAELVVLAGVASLGALLTVLVWDRSAFA